MNINTFRISSLILKNNRLILFLLLSILFSVGFAQNPTIQFKNIPLSEFGTGNVVEQVLQDYKGYMWFASQNGLCCYNGSKTKIYDAQSDSNSIPYRGIRSLFEDSQKRLWIGTENGRIALYNRLLDNFTRININVETKAIFDFFELPNKTMLVASFNGLYLFDYEKKTIKVLIKNIPIRDFVSFSSNSILLATENNGIILFDTKSLSITKKYKLTPTVETLDKKLVVFHFCKDESDTIWASTNSGGLYCFDKKNDSFKNVKLSINGKQIREELFYITVDSHKNFWIGGINTGLILFNKLKRSFCQYTSESANQIGLSSKTISSIIEDKSHSIWLSTHSGGVHYFNLQYSGIKQYFSGYKNIRSLSDNTVSCFQKVSNETTIIGLDGGGLNLFDKKTNTFSYFTTKDGLPDNAITDICKDDNQTYWASTWNGGVFHFAVVNKTIKPITIPKQLAEIVTSKGIFFDSKARLWIASLKSGVVIYDTKSGTISSHNNPGVFNPSIFEDNGIIDFQEDGNHNMWICSYNAIFRLSPQQKLTKFQVPVPKGSASQGNAALFAFLKSDNSLWISTYYGLIRFDEKSQTFISFTEKCGLPSTIKSIVETSDGHLWMASSKGIVDFNPQTNSFILYDDSYDMNNNTFRDRSAVIDFDGTILFGGTNGFIAFKPAQLHSNKNIPPVEITGFYVFNALQSPSSNINILKQNIAETDVLEIPYSMSVLTFEFASLNYISPEKNKYKYILRGFDKDWVTAGSERKATYTNLSPGTYVFTVIASNNSGIWNNTGKSITIHILPPWWKTWWFRLLITLICMLGFVLFYLYKTQQIRSQNKQLELLVHQRTAELESANSKLRFSHEELLTKNELLAEQADTMQSNIFELSKTNNTKDRLFSLIAHDLKNPFSSLLGLSEHLKVKYSNLSESQKYDYVVNIFDSSKNIFSLLEQLFDWARSQSKRINKSPVHFNLKPMLDELLELFSTAAHEKQIKLYHTISPNVVLFADKTMVHTVIRNLIHNAIKFTNINGVVSIESIKSNDKIQITITDDGVGMSSQKIISLFDVSEVNSTYGTNNESGTGLGLVICKEFVEMNAGTISVQSQEDIGTSFIVELPEGDRNLVENEKVNVKRINPVESSNETIEEIITNNETVLIVEDNELIRMSLVTELSKYFKVIAVENGVECLDMLEQTKPDIIVSDIQMPKMDGISLCKSLHEKEETCDIPIILLTALNVEKSYIESLQAGADDYIQKPFKTVFLAARIVNILEKRQALQKRYQTPAAIWDLPDKPLTRDEILLQKLKGTLSKNFADSEYSVEQLASDVGMSRVSLYRKVKSMLKISPIEYINQMRLAYAATLLETGNYRVSEVAYMSGFSEPNYFSNCFSQQYGCTPTEYTKKRANN